MRDKGMRKFIKGFSYAFSGLINTFKTEVNFRFHVFATFITIALGWYLSLSTLEWLWVFLSIALVLSFELMNTALEAICNRLSMNFDPSIKKAKDAAAAAVLLVSVFALLVGVFIFVPKIVELLSH